MGERVEMHYSTVALLKFFDYEHLPTKLQDVSKPFCELAHKIATDADRHADNIETTVCLRKLLEAKDCAVRAAL
jgi:hypothetical protein